MESLVTINKVVITNSDAPCRVLILLQRHGKRSRHAAGPGDFNGRILVASVRINAIEEITIHNPQNIGILAMHGMIKRLQAMTAQRTICA